MSTKNSRKPVTAANRTKTSAFTLIELLVVVAIIALLISILLPSLADAREQAKRVKCGAEMQQMGLGLKQCENDNYGCVPLIDDSVSVNMYSWIDVLYDEGYIGNINIQKCPSSDGKDPSMIERVDSNWSFYYTDRVGLGDGVNPANRKKGVRSQYAISTIYSNSWQSDRYDAGASRQVIVTDGFWNWFGSMSAHWVMSPIIFNSYQPVVSTPNWEGGMIGFRHGRNLAANFLFLDGHVQAVAPRRPRSAIEYLDYSPGAKGFMMIDTMKYFTWLPGEGSDRLDVYWYAYHGQVEEWKDQSKKIKPGFCDPRASYPGWYGGSGVPANYPQELDPGYRTAPTQVPGQSPIPPLWRKLPGTAEARL